jgi:hypothetical protein
MGFAPYRSVNLYVRGAISEAWALGFLPLIVIGVDQCWKRERAGFWILSVALAGLVLTHNLTALMVVPWLLIWSLCWPWIRDGVIHAWMPWRWGRALAMKAYIQELCAAAMAGCGLSAFYAIPALLENHLTQIHTIFQGYFFYALHFLYARQLLEPSWHYGGSGWGPQDGLSFFIGWGVLGGAVLFGVAALLWRKRLARSQAGRLGSLAALSMLIALFLTLQRSAGIWDHVAVMQMFQFPWRFLTLGVFFGSVLAVSGVMAVSTKWQKAAGVFMIVCAWAAVSWFRPESFLDHSAALYFDDAQRIQKEMSPILPDYTPITADLSYLQVHPRRDTQVLQCESCTIKQQIETLVDRMHERAFRMTFTQPTLVQFAIADFPGWQAWINGASVPVTHDVHGLLQLSVPAGESIVSLRFGETPLRWWCDVISVATVMILAMYGFIQAQHTSREDTTPLQRFAEKTTSWRHKLRAQLVR